MTFDMKQPTAKEMFSIFDISTRSCNSYIATRKLARKYMKSGDVTKISKLHQVGQAILANSCFQRYQLSLLDYPAS